MILKTIFWIYTAYVVRGAVRMFHDDSWKADLDGGLERAVFLLFSGLTLLLWPLLLLVGLFLPDEE